jgi:CHAD domain-containing protein
VPKEEQYELRLGEALERRRGPVRSASLGRRHPRAGGDGSRGPARPLARKAGIWVLPREATAGEAFMRTLEHCRSHILANLPAVSQSHEVEGVHQLRVALRRLRVALVAFGADFRTPELDALRLRAKLLAAGLGPARDMDVFLDELMAPAQADAGLPEAFALLRARATARRDAAWQTAVNTASSLAFHSFVHDLTQAIAHRAWYEAGSREEDRLLRFDQPVRLLADRQLAHYFRKAKKRARKLQSLNEAQRHELRIALKKLRYTLEFFSSLYDPKMVRSFVRRLSLMQDVLGSLQDLAVARRILHDLVEAASEQQAPEQGELRFAAGTVYGWHLERANAAWSEAKLRWKRLSKTEPFWSPS